MAPSTFGNALAFFSAICFAWSVVCVSRSGIREGDRGVFFSVLVTIGFSAALWLLSEGPKAGDVGTGDWWRGIVWFTVAGICAMVLGRNLLFASIRRLGVTRASATKRLNPFFSVACAAIFLSERITPLAGLGMAVIAMGFGLLVRDSLTRTDDGIVIPIAGYGWGVAAAIAYAGAYVTRKLGLADLPAPAFGTLVSALAGLGFMLVTATLSLRHRQNLLGVFRNLDRWLVMASVAMSVGQISLFVALLYQRISVIVMIASLEVFIASFLAVVVFRTELRPGPMTQAAAVLATIGVALVAFG